MKKVIVSIILFCFVTGSRCQSIKDLTVGVLSTLGHKVGLFIMPLGDGKQQMIIGMYIGDSLDERELQKYVESISDRIYDTLRTTDSLPFFKYAIYQFPNRTIERGKPPFVYDFKKRLLARRRKDEL